MSVFEQCLPYRDLGFDKDLTCDVLEDDEDILTQISAQLDIPSISAPGCHPGTSLLPPLEGLESGMLDDMVMEDLNTYSSYTDSGISSDSSIKSEPCSPSSSSQDRSPPLSPVQGLSFVNSVNNINKVSTFLSQPPVPAMNTISLPGPSLSGKVAIPKLTRPVMSAPAPLVTSANVTSVTGPPPPLVLVCNQNQSSGPIFVKTEPVQSTGFCSPLITGGPTVSGHTNAEELRNLKRQQRMIKNRESACISRKKKKEYVTQLEDQIKMLSSENTLLRNENENLKEKLRELQTEKSMWTDSLMRNSNGKKATAVLALLFMVSLNMSSLTEIYNSGDPDLSSSLRTNVHVREAGQAGRSLLWVDEDALEAAEADLTLTNITDPGQCGGSGLNQTESIRMESDLRGWFNVETPAVKRRPDVTRRPTRSPKKKSRTYPVGNVVRTPMHSLTGSVYHMLTQDPGPSNALNLYSNVPRNTFASFFEAIERRDDTFYVVSFSGDHLLVPATNNNKTSRPLMSLMLPAVVSNNSSDSNQSDTVAMMKIDCQVINTQMVHIMKDAIPNHLAANKRNNKTGDGEDNDYDTDKVFSASFKRNASRRADNRTFNTQSYEDKTKSNPKMDRKRKQFGSN